MRYTKYEEMRSREILRDHSYRFLYYLLWDYSFLDKCLSRKKNGKKSDSYSEVYMMFDTETSKHHRPKRSSSGDGRSSLIMYVPGLYPSGHLIPTS